MVDFRCYGVTYVSKGILHDFFYISNMFCGSVPRNYTG